jgi:hypothetical protein
LEKLPSGDYVVYTIDRESVALWMDGSDIDGKLAHEHEVVSDLDMELIAESFQNRLDNSVTSECFTDACEEVLGGRTFPDDRERTDA